jgi:hypothetical protein
MISDRLWRSEVVGWPGRACDSSDTNPVAPTIPSRSIKALLAASPNGSHHEPMVSGVFGLHEAHRREHELAVASHTGSRHVEIHVAGQRLAEALLGEGGASPTTKCARARLTPVCLS